MNEYNLTQVVKFHTTLCNNKIPLINPKTGEAIKLLKKTYITEIKHNYCNRNRNHNHNTIP
jgi:hypothetical protein